MSTGWIFLGVLVILVLFAFGAYNRLVALGQRVGQAFADIDVQLKQRHDLIPNLVETVKGYASHERGTLDDVIKIAASRRFFNNAVQEYNTGIQQMPAALFAGMFGFTRKDFFDLGASRTEVETVPNVKF